LLIRKRGYRKSEGLKKRRERDTCPFCGRVEIIALFNERRPFYHVNTSKCGT
jgi:hypothetical protein